MKLLIFLVFAGFMFLMLSNTPQPLSSFEKVLVVFFSGIFIMLTTCVYLLIDISDNIIKLLYNRK